MSYLYHILNGDCLKENFPSQLVGEGIITRECLVDGDLTNINLENFYIERAQFLVDHYGLNSIEEYYDKSALEFEKIKAIPENADIYLWFEDDLFCQVNFWFVAYLLWQNERKYNIYLVRPETHTQYGFGGLGEDELMDIYENRMLIDNLESIAKLWKSYQQDDLNQLIKRASELKMSMPFVLDAVQAHIERKPTEDHPGRPIQSLLDIMKELDTKEFEPIFKEFSKREKIYGFGDLQVRRLVDLI